LETAATCSNVCGSIPASNRTSSNASAPGTISTTCPNYFGGEPKYGSSFLISLQICIASSTNNAFFELISRLLKGREVGTKNASEEGQNL